MILSRELLASAAIALSVATANPDVPWSVFSFVVSSAAGVYTFFARRDAAAAADLKRVEKDLSVLTERVEHLPTSDEVSQLTSRVAELSTEMRLTRESFKAWGLRVERQEEFLLQKKGGS